MSELKFEAVDLEGPKRYFSALTPQTLGHAYLFTGPQGVGKKTFARQLAQSLLCSAHGGANAAEAQDVREAATHPKSGLLGYDGTCTSCALFGAGENARHPDFFEHEGALKIGDRDVAAGFADREELTARDVVRQLSMQSYSGGMRVLLLGDVDFASPAAANALLKFLEEPPRGVVMLLTTAVPGRLLSTIRSRLVEVPFGLLHASHVAEILAGMGYSKSDADLGAALGGGSVTQALAALEGEEESLRAQVARWFFESVRGKSPEQSWATRETLEEGLQTLKTLVRDWSILSQGAGKPLMGDYAVDLAKLPALEPRSIVAILGKIGDAQRLARTNVSAAMVGEIVRMAITKAP
jgi:DNA polymerase-3 subunit delta'